MQITGTRLRCVHWGVALLLASNAEMRADEMDTFSEWQGKYHNFLKDNARPLFDSYQRRLLEMERTAAAARNYALAAKIKLERLAAAREAGANPTEAVTSVGAKLSEFPTVLPQENGSIEFSSTAAEVGGGVSLNAETGSLMGWTSEAAFARWRLPDGLKTGGYEVEITYSCRASDNAGGGAFLLKEDVYHLRHEARDTGAWDTYQTEKCGTLRLKSSSQQLTLSAATVKGAGLFQVKLVVLRPVSALPISSSP